MALKLGELLIAHKLLTEAQLKKALAAQRLYGGKLGTNLVELGFVSEIDLATLLAKQLKMSAADPGDFDSIPENVLALVPKEMVEKHRMIPLRLDQKLHVAISDPAMLPALDELSFKAGKSIRPLIAPEIWIVAALERYYGLARDVRYVQVTTETEESAMIPMAQSLVNLAEMVNAEESPALATPVRKEAAPAPLDSPLEDYIRQLLASHSPESVFGALLTFLAPFFPRMALYAIRRDQIVGWLVRGFPLRTAEFGKVQLSLTAPSLIRAVVEKEVPFRGEIPATAESQTLFGPLGLGKRHVGIYPIRCRSKVITVLLGVPEGAEPPRPVAGQLIPAAISKAEMALEMLYLQRLIARTDTAPRT